MRLVIYFIFFLPFLLCVSHCFFVQFTISLYFVLFNHKFFISKRSLCCKCKHLSLSPFFSAQKASNWRYLLKMLIVHPNVVFLCLLAFIYLFNLSLCITFFLKQQKCCLYRCRFTAEKILAGQTGWHILRWTLLTCLPEFYNGHTFSFTLWH